MTESLITFETAKLAKEKGFAIWNDSYSEEGALIPLRSQALKIEYCKYPAPTQSLLQKWLREVHNAHIWVYPISLTDYKWHYFIGAGYTFSRQSTHKTYEEALETCLSEVLKQIP